MGQSGAHQREKEEEIFATYISLWPLLQARTHMGAPPAPCFSLEFLVLICVACEGGLWGRAKGNAALSWLGCLQEAEMF